MTDHSCDICRKHSSGDGSAGQLVARPAGFWVFHAPPGADGRAPLGYLYIETDRHAPYLADLTQEEAAALGRIRSVLAAALRDAFDPEFVFAAVIGRSIAHFHEHLFVRHRGTGAEVTWDASDEAAPRADEAQVAELVDRLRSALTAAGM
jgi:ATP adenylyltransferase